MSILDNTNVKIKWDKNKRLKILAIGNSFSDDALWLLPDILRSMGMINYRISNLYLPGCLLERHLENIKNDSAIYEFRTNTGDGWGTTFNTKLLDAVKADDWDYITFQQGSTKSGLPNSYADLDGIIETVKSLKPLAKLGWHMTWAYQQGFNSVEFINHYEGKQIVMYNAIIDSVKMEIANNKDISFIIPNGTAVQNARTSVLGDTITRDGFHMSYDIGRYITGLTYASIITGYPIDNIDFVPDDLNDKIKNICVESVNNAIKKPFTITRSLYK